MEITETKEFDPDKELVLELDSDDYRIIIIRVYQGRPCGCGSKDKNIMIMKGDTEKIELLKQLIKLEDDKDIKMDSKLI